MVEMKTIFATRRLAYGRRALQAGDSFEASARDADALVNAGLATARDEKVSKKGGKGVYSTRMLTAEQAGKEEGAKQTVAHTKRAE